MTMDHNAFGSTGRSISRVGLGAWAIGGQGWKYAWGAQDDASSIAAIRHAVASGVTWVDTAACYGRGHSEEVVARALADLPRSERPLVFTKCGVIAPEGDADPSLVGAPASLRREVEDSLRRLRTDVIDCYFMHWPAQDGTPLEDYWGTLADLRAAGKVRWIGLSNHDRDQLERAHAIARVDAIQPPFSAIRRETAERILPWAADNGVGVIVYSPMQSGLLTGAIDAARVATMPADDWRRHDDNFNGETLRRNLAVQRALAAVGARYGRSSGEAALAWVLGWRGVSGAIVGARSTAQVDGWIGGGDLRLDASDYAAIAAAIEGAGAGTGPIAPAA